MYMLCVCFNNTKEERENFTPKDCQVKQFLVDQKYINSKLLDLKISNN